MSIRIVVDLNRCGVYGQCVFAAPDLFRLPHENVLEWEYEAEDGAGPAALRAAWACPVGAIAVDDAS